MWKVVVPPKLTGSIALFFDAVTKQRQSTLGERIYFSLKVTVYQGKPRQEFNTEILRQELKKSPWRNTTYWPAQLSFLYSPAQACLLGNGTALSVLGPAISINT